MNMLGMLWNFRWPMDLVRCKFECMLLFLSFSLYVSISCLIQLIVSQCMYGRKLCVYVYFLACVWLMLMCGLFSLCLCSLYQRVLTSWLWVPGGVSVFYWDSISFAKWFFSPQMSCVLSFLTTTPFLLCLLFLTCITCLTNW